MFSKPRSDNASTNKPATKPAASTAKTAVPGPASSKPKPAPSILSSDLTIKGNITTSGDVQVEGTVEGDIRAHLLTVGEGSTVRGEVIADDVVVNGRVVGRLRGLKVRLTATARVEGDIIHKAIAIESGAHFEGTVQRQEDPLLAKPPKASE
ncbi:MAG: polymer-forming cytoskeletal protein [Paracoccaceae bacterium]